MPRRIEIPEPVGSLIDLMMVALRTTDPKEKAEISAQLKECSSDRQGERE